jgi:hypothetical protein
MKTLLATAAVLAAFVLPGHASDMGLGVATALIYFERCVSDNPLGDLKPEVVHFAKVWQSKHPADVEENRNYLLTQIKGAAPGDWTLEEAMPIWCSIAKRHLPEEFLRK